MHVRTICSIMFAFSLCMQLYACPIVDSCITHLNTYRRHSSPSPLHQAAKEGNTKKLQDFLKSQDPDERDIFDNTALEIAIRAQREACCHILLEYGANANLSNMRMMTPLQLCLSNSATREKKEQIAQMLVMHGAIIDKSLEQCDKLLFRRLHSFQANRLRAIAELKQGIHNTHGRDIAQLITVTMLGSDHSRSFAS